MNDKCLNTTIPVCFWCHEPKDEIVIANKLVDCDDKMPMHTVIDWEPCDKCIKEWSKGTVLIEITENQPEDKRPEIGDGVYPTGNMWVVDNTVAKNIFEDKYNSIILIDKEVAEKIGLYELTKEKNEA
jgi:hypothetical protein